MRIENIDQANYSSIIQQHKLAYNSPLFSEINQSKVTEIDYLLFKDRKYKMGIILGYKDKKAFCPFSAPYAMFSIFRKSIKIEDLNNAIVVLDDYLLEKKVKSIRFTLPPMFYDETMISKTLTTLFNNGYTIQYIDVNYQYMLKDFCPDYINKIRSNARKNLNIALKNQMAFIKCDTKEMDQLAYLVIKENREYKNYPLKMTFEQIEQTANVIKREFFLVNHQTESVAAALAFWVSDKVIQIIYWGDRPGFSELKPMNFLSYKIFEYYKNLGMDIVDIGPSSENGIPNYGLCDFKESIGCEVSSKFILEKEICHE